MKKYKKHKKTLNLNNMNNLKKNTKMVFLIFLKSVLQTNFKKHESIGHSLWIFIFETNPSSSVVIWAEAGSRLNRHSAFTLLCKREIYNGNVSIFCMGLLAFSIYSVCILIFS